MGPYDHTLECERARGPGAAPLTTTGSIARLFQRGAAQSTFGLHYVVECVEAALLGLQRPRTRVGRYELEAVVGSGGAGVVYRARDPELQRRVAVKLLRGTTHPEPGTVDRRLLAEARALASVEHGNVVDVFDVGVLDDDGRARIYLVMEWIEGSDLSVWIRGAPSVVEVLDAYTGACRGLAAVHTRGVIHRDFKPANVLRDASGIVKVADFGLAEPIRRRDDSWTDLTRRSDANTEPQTAGTPRYMSPEQHEGQPLDARTDQYSLCVALYEALFGEAPFKAATIVELAAKKRHGPPTIPRRHGVSPAVARAIRRGLQPDPADRFSSMAQLAAALVEGTRPRRRLGTAVLLGALTLAGAGLASGPPPPTCPDRDRVRRVNDERVVARAVRGRGSEEWAPVTSTLDDHLNALANAQTRSCDLPEGDTRDATMRCLDSRLEAVSTLVGSLDDVRTPRIALAAARDLPPVEDCSTRSVGDRAVGDAVGERLADDLLPVVVLQSLGRYREALERVDAVLRRRGPVPGWVAGNAEVIRAELLNEVGRSEEAIVALESVFFVAVENDDPQTSAAAAMALVGLLYERGRLDDALGWSAHAQSQLDSLDAVPLGRRIAWLHNTAMAHFWAGDIERARALLAEAITLRTHETVLTELDAMVHGSYGTVLLFAGEADLALQEHIREVEIRHELNGDADAELVGAYLNQGNALYALGRDARALDAFVAAERLAEEAGRNDVDAVSATLSRLRTQARVEPRRELAAQARRALGRLADASQAHRASAALVVAEVIRRVESCEAAIEPTAAALADLEHALGREHHVVGTAYAELGITLRECGRRTEAGRALDNALDVLRAALPAGHPQVRDIAAARRVLEEDHA